MVLHRKRAPIVGAHVDVQALAAKKDGRVPPKLRKPARGKIATMVGVGAKINSGVLFLDGLHKLMLGGETLHDALGFVVFF